MDCTKSIFLNVLCQFEKIEIYSQYVSEYRPMAPREGYKLASYKLPENLIESLKAEAEKRGTSQTALLVQGLEYVLGIASNTALDVPDIDQRIESAIAPLNAQMEEIKASLGKFKPKSKEFSPDR